MILSDETVGTTIARPPGGSHVETARVAVLANLSRALESHSAIEAAAVLCLRALCDGTPWRSGCFVLTDCEKAGVAAVSIAHPANVEAQSDVAATPAVFSVDVGAEASARFELCHDVASAVDGAATDFVAVIATLLGRVIERSILVQGRDKAEVDRSRRWALVKQSQDGLREQYARLYTALNNMSQGLAMYDEDGRLVLCNDLYAAMYQLTAADVRPGTTLDKIAARRRAKGYDIMDAAGEGAFETSGALALKSDTRKWRLGDGRRILVSVQPLWNGGWVTTHEDATEREQFEERISHLAHHDALTDLANRLLFHERLDRSLADVARGGEGLAVHWFDLDRFKIINDTLGHITGDLVLKAVARRLRHCVRETDLVARLGGDEFAILQAPIKSAADADTLARRVREVLSAPFMIEGQRILIDTSSGICLAPEDTIDADQLLLNADTALYRAKAEGRGTHRFFSHGMDAIVQARRQLEAKLRQALEADAFQLHYQPIVDLNTGGIVACEALLRWTDGELGSISPTAFIPVAEEAGLMERLGRWVLMRACLDAARWPDAVSVAVNISPSHVMSQQVTADVVRALQASGLPAERLEVEITETVLMQHTDEALSVLHDLGAKGVRLAMDDFGTGYSSLAYLGRFPFSKIKIDRSFVAGLPEDRSSHAIVKAITGLSEGLGVITTAEGVETEAQLTAVLALGCTQVQGFLFSKAVPIDDLLRLFAEREAEGCRGVRSLLQEAANTLAVTTLNEGAQALRRATGWQETARRASA